MTNLLRSIYEEALKATDPARLVQERLSEMLDRGIVEADLDLLALGKCADGLAAGAIRALTPGRCLLAVPAGYEVIGLENACERVVGSHPDLTPASFEAGERVVEFVRASRRPILVLISGGASATIEIPLEPWFDRDDLVAIHHALIRAGLPIESINTVRKHLSAIKGGRLGALLPRGSITLIHSDVPWGLHEMAGSGPTVADRTSNHDAVKILEKLATPLSRDLARRLDSAPETVKSLETNAIVLADNRTLVEAAANSARRRALEALVVERDFTGDVECVALELAEHANQLREGQVLLAGGEPSVRIRGSGRGGRCTELAVHLGRELARRDISISALLASSDGVDGSSGIAGVMLDPSKYTRIDWTHREICDSIARSDSISLVPEIGEPFIIPPTGNNLRDLYLLARVSQGADPRLRAEPGIGGSKLHLIQ